MKRIVYISVIICLLAGIVGTAGCTGLPPVSPPGEKETPGAAEPEGKLLQLYPGELANQLFNEDLTELQRENIWDKYKGKGVKWVGQVMDVKTWKDSLVATFLHWPSASVVLLCEEKQAENLSRLSKNDLVIYSGVLDGYGKDADLFPPDGILYSPPRETVLYFKQQVLRLRDGVIDGSLLTPLWSNQEIDVGCCGCPVIVDNNMVYVMKPREKERIVSGPPQYETVIYTLDAQSGVILWQSMPFEGPASFLGIDKTSIYFVAPYLYRSGRTTYTGTELKALNKVTGQISPSVKFLMGSQLLWANNGVAYMYEGNAVKAVDITTQETLWSFQPLPDEKLGEIKVGADTVFIERENGELLGLDKNTGEEKYIKQPSGRWSSCPCRIFGLDLTSRKVFIECNGSLQCLDEVIGELLWQNKGAPTNRDFLELLETCGSTLIIRMELHVDTLYALDTNTGRVKWSKRCYEPETTLAAGDGVVISYKSIEDSTLQASRLQEVP